MSLSPEQPLVYVRRATGVHGRLATGSILRLPDGGLNVYDNQGRLVEYLSGDALRSWFVVDSYGKPMLEWSSIMPQDEDLASSFEG